MSTSSAGSGSDGDRDRPIFRRDDPAEDARQDKSAGGHAETSPSGAPNGPLLSRIVEETLDSAEERQPISSTELATLVDKLAIPSVLKLLTRYPTAQKIASARLSSIQSIPHLRKGKAQQIHSGCGPHPDETGAARLS